MSRFFAAATLAVLAFAAAASAQDRETGPNPLAAGDADAGKAKSAPCAACHGADGNSTNPEWPKLAGQNPDYLVQQLKHFKSGERQNTVMSGMVANLSEQDMKDLAAFFSKQQRTPGVADESLVDQGRQLYRGGDAETALPACMACHGPTGSGIAAAGFPAIGGQHAQYVYTQLQAYASGQRHSINGIMNSVAERMDDDQMKALSSYVEGLHLRKDAFAEKK